MAHRGPPSLPPADRQPACAGVLCRRSDGLFHPPRQGNVSITFSSARVNHRADPGPVSRVVVGHVVLPTSAAAALALGLYDFLRKMGIDPGRPAPDQAAH
jgi:hypothetical protein